MIETDLTEDLIFLSRAGFRERLAEEVALVRNVLFNGANAGDIRAEEDAGGHKAVEQNADGAEIGFKRDKVHAADVAGLREVKTCLRGVDSRELLFNGRTADKDHIGKISASVEGVFECGIKYGLSERGILAINDSTGGGEHTAGLVSLGGIACELVNAVNEGIFNIAGDFLNSPCGLEIQFIWGAALVKRGSNAAESAAAGLFGVGHGDFLMKYLSNVGILGADVADCGRRGKRSRL